MADKKAKLEEAIARGQLPFAVNPRPAKRPRLEQRNHGANKGRASDRGRRKNGPPGGLDGALHPNIPTTPIQPTPEPLSLRHPLPSKPPASAVPGDHDSSDSDDAPPEALSTKTTKNTAPEPLPLPETHRNSVNIPVKPSSEKPTGPGRLTVPQPRGPPPIPFGQNTPLLINVGLFACTGLSRLNDPRNQLLLPEIRNTVSNLSQAIRFLVDNDFLENVELKPGDAERQKHRIQVLSSTEDSPNEPE